VIGFRVYLKFQTFPSISENCRTTVGHCDDW